MEKIADIATIVGVGLALVIAFLTFAGFTWPRYRAWLRREVWLRIKGLRLFGGRYITLKSRLLLDIPQDRCYKRNKRYFDPNMINCSSEDRTGKSFKLTASIDEKDDWITDWKGCRYCREGYKLREIWLQVWPYSYEDAKEWKVGISILKSDLPAPTPYEHRLYGKGQICFEISRHHKEGKQAVLSVFEGNPFKVRSDKISEGNWTWLRVRINDKELEFYTGFDSIAVFDTDTKTDIQDFEPGELWLVFWTDAKTNMAVCFRRIKTYWRKKK